MSVSGPAYLHPTLLLNRCIWAFAITAAVRLTMPRVAGRKNQLAHDAPRHQVSTACLRPRRPQAGVDLGSGMTAKDKQLGPLRVAQPQTHGLRGRIADSGGGHSSPVVAECARTLMATYSIFNAGSGLIGIERGHAVQRQILGKSRATRRRLRPRIGVHARGLGRLRARSLAKSGGRWSRRIAEPQPVPASWEK
jgi:hypothetical protein